MANVESVEHGNGDVSIGLTIGGTFVPFATQSQARIAQLQERAANLRERSGSGDSEDEKRVDEALASLPIEVPKAKSSPSRSRSKSGSARSRSRTTDTGTDTGTDDEGSDS